MTKQARWAWALSAVVVTALVLVVAFVLALTGEVARITENQVLWLFRINVAVAGLLALVIVIAAVRLAVRTHRRKFGSLLLTKLAGITVRTMRVPTVPPLATTAWMTSRTRSGLPMLPGLIRRQAAPALAASTPRL